MFLLKKSLLHRLTPEEQKELEFYEQEIRKGDLHFLRAGLALLFIWKRRLYRGESNTFRGYLTDKWGMSRSRGYQLILAAAIFAELKKQGIDIGLQSVSSLLALKGLNPIYAAKAYSQAKAENGGNEPPAWKIKRTIKKLKLKVKRKKRREKDTDNSNGSSSKESFQIKDFKRSLVPVRLFIKHFIEHDKKSPIIGSLKDDSREIKRLLYEQIAILDEWEDG